MRSLGIFTELDMMIDCLFGGKATLVGSDRRRSTRVIAEDLIDFFSDNRSTTSIARAISLSTRLAQTPLKTRRSRRAQFVRG